MSREPPANPVGVSVQPTAKGVGEYGYEYPRCLCQGELSAVDLINESMDTAPCYCATVLSYWNT